MAKETLTGGKPYVKWEKIGQEIVGVLLSVEMSRSSRGGKIAHMVNEDGEAFIISAPTLLAETLEENFARLEGRTLTITFTEQDKPARASESGLMHFTVDFDNEEKQAGSGGRART